uniref:SFRICE_002527 n=1 Tax=Spodoptera frugiperda TaxID=7108 RepID=A0A2H1W2R0_SPOFR
MSNLPLCWVNAFSKLSIPDKLLSSGLPMVHDIRPNRKKYEIATAIAHSSLDTKLCSTNVANESNFTGPSDYKGDKLISKLVLKMERNYQSIIQRVIGNLRQMKVTCVMILTMLNIAALNVSLSIHPFHQG